MPSHELSVRLRPLSYQRAMDLDIISTYGGSALEPVYNIVSFRRAGLDRLMVNIQTARRKLTITEFLGKGVIWQW